ncbi:MAG: hypothetical protein A2126_03000 [Candidatus Woykebacteria bacterium GWB1_45_5]|uniref:Uncharacterized protein n=1 Tax=Candidatus Woykebacteria bacterium GWB1_45_5 TaxID=1802592 RepID=A0A1G1W7H7_9BACT|nr:MAG: hypothetical protein A2126_03000 [Candidatus Woykebacteria bacterium GWB1_45_5]
MSIWNEREQRLNYWTTGFWAAFIIVVIIGFWLVIASTIWGLRVATAGIYGRGEAHIQIQSAPFRLEAYQSFFDQCASIQGLEGQIDELTAQLAQLEPGTRAYNYTLSSLTGAKGLRHNAIAKYNQDALKDYTEGQFRDNDLPYQLVDSDYPPGSGAVVPNGGKTVCAVR